MKNMRLVDAREALKLTQEELAQKVGISRSFYALIENGDRQPSLPVAVRLASVTGLPITIFLASDVSSGDKDTAELMSPSR